MDMVIETLTGPLAVTLAGAAIATVATARAAVKNPAWRKSVKGIAGLGVIGVATLAGCAFGYAMGFGAGASLFLAAVEVGSMRLADVSFFTLAFGPAICGVAGSLVAASESFTLIKQLLNRKPAPPKPVTPKIAPLLAA